MKIQRDLHHNIWFWHYNNIIENKTKQNKTKQKQKKKKKKLSPPRIFIYSIAINEEPEGSTPTIYGSGTITSLLLAFFRRERPKEKRLVLKKGKRREKREGREREKKEREEIGEERREKRREIKE